MIKDSQNNVLKHLVADLKGVGKVKANDLGQLGIVTIEDLLLYFPYRYEDRRLRELSEVEHDETITVLGTIHSEASVRFYGRKKSRMSVRVMVDRYLVTAVFFNRHFAKKHFQVSKKIRLSGKWHKHRLQITVNHYSLGDKAEQNQEEHLIPIYAVSAKINQAYLGQLIDNALEQYTSDVPEIIPQELMQAYKLMPRGQAIYLLHKPRDHDDGKWAKRRMIYEEFFLFQMKIHALKKRHREQQQGLSHTLDNEQIERFILSLPFTLTTAQKKVLDEIFQDLKAPAAMNRLLQGDVGSGKTVIAALTLFASITSGLQGAFMVPTEILAVQHYLSLKRFFANEHIQMALLTGKTTAKERKAILAGLQMGTIDLVIGTHALIQDDVYFKHLGLIVTDEQHRFGVNQRRKLRQKGLAPDVLFMTATPIPRTLSITVFGDLDVSIIDELPQGRKPIETYWVKSNLLSRVFSFMEKEMLAGRQVYVICPLIEESEKMAFQNVIDFHAEISERFPIFRIGLLHSRMPAEEKSEVMASFSSNKIQTLVATTVIEVGVDIPNATLMVIQDAERFGLSQLHQLRGRIGRGEHQSYCILIADPKTEIGQERMNVMQSTTDGFEIARQDLKLRGAGEFFGTKQSGLPEFKVGDMLRDHKALEVARQDAQALIQSEEFWTEPKYDRLRQYVQDEQILGDKLD